MKEKGTQRVPGPHLCDDHANMVPAFGPFRQMAPRGYPVPFFPRWSLTSDEKRLLATK
jgi:hypothetical protein